MIEIRERIAIFFNTVKPPGINIPRRSVCRKAELDYCFLSKIGPSRLLFLLFSKIAHEEEDRRTKAQKRKKKDPPDDQKNHTDHIVILRGEVKEIHMREL